MEGPGRKPKKAPRSCFGLAKLRHTFVGGEVSIKAGEKQKTQDIER